jgi:heterodisulfide reductase subunit A
VAQASAAAARVLSIIDWGSIAMEAITSVIDKEHCSGCKTCLGLCPYNAITFDEKDKVSVVNEALCKGCGTCAAACPSGAITSQHFSEGQIMAELEGILL